MAAQSAEFAIDLRTDGTTGAAEEAAGALESLRKSIEGDTKGIREMEKALRNLKRGGLENTDQFSKLKDQVEQKKKAVGESQAAYLKLGGSFSKAGKAGKDTGKDFHALTEISKRMPGPLGQVVGKIAEFAKSGAAAKALALKVAFVALTVGILAAGAAMLSYGISSSEARRNESLSLEGLTKVRNWYGRTADSAGFLQEQIDRVSASSSLGRSEVTSYTEQLYRMGLRAGNLQTALEGVALVAATQGDGQAQIFASMAVGAAHAGTSIKKLTDDAKARLGDLASRKLLSLDVQLRKLRENVSYVFSGLKIEGFLKGLNEVTSLFSANTATGRALKAIFESLFNPLLSGFEGAGSLAKRFFQGMVIAALHFMIVLLKIRNSVRGAFGFEAYSGAEKMRLALAAGVVVGGLLATALTIVAVKAAIIAAPFVALAAAISGAFYAGYKFGQMIIWAVETAMSLDWAYFGTSMVEGIVGGIKKGVSWVVEAMTNLAKSGWNAFKKAMGIASPSRLMAITSMELPRGSAVGIRAGIPEVKRATEAMAAVIPSTFEARVGSTGSSIPSPVSELPAPVASATKGGGLTSGANRSITIGNITIETVAQDAAGIARDFKDQMMIQLQDILASLGGEPVST